MTRTEIINYLIKENNYSSYLELGCQNDVNFKAIDLRFKIGVDPVSGGTHRMTSDEFFKDSDMTFDLIFIDGLHETAQVDKDITNSLKLLSPNGIIVLHDCNPIKKEHQEVPRISKHWNGDVWKSIIKFQLHHTNYQVHVVDTDEGIGLITKLSNGNYESLLVSDDLLIYENLETHRQLWLNLITVEEFKKLY